MKIEHPNTEQEIMIDCIKLLDINLLFFSVQRS